MSDSVSVDSFRLNERLEFRSVWPFQPTQVAAQIQEALEARQTIEVDPRARSRRRLAGSVNGAALCLTVWDENLWTRRKSWNIELDAQIDGTADGSVVHGTIDIPDRGALTALMRLFRVAAAIPGVFAVAPAFRDGRVDIGSIVFAVLVVAGSWLVTSKMQTEGEKAAAEDARLLDEALRRLIA